MLLNDLTTVGLLLCSGHRWKHFVLIRREAAKPLLVYLGEVDMRVLRGLIHSSLAPKTGKRPSWQYCDVNKVDRTEVENVMLALHCTLHSGEYFTLDS